MSILKNARHRRLSFWVLGSAFVAGTALADARSDLAAILANENKTASQQIHLFWTRGGVTDDYTIQIAPLGRVRVVRAAAGHTFEFIAIAPTMYYRLDGSAWQQTPYQKSAAPAPTLLTDFLKSLSNVTEVPSSAKAGNPTRTLKGFTSWHNGKQDVSGQIELNAAGTLLSPSRMQFIGTCGAQPCSFVQTFTYDKTVKVQAPP